MGEYEAFPYQNHKAPVHTRIFHVEAKKPLTFDELYSPRGDGGAPVNIGTTEKSYWRTRDRVSFSFWECRAQKVIIITCKDVSSAAGVAFKTIVVNLEVLYKELDQRKRGVDPPEELLFKANKGLQTDAELHKAAIAHLSNRLNIVEEPRLWPAFDEAAWLAERAVAAVSAAKKDAQAGENGEEADAPPKKPAAAAAPVAALDGISAGAAAGAAEAAAAVPAPLERMVTLNTLSADTITLEMPVEALRVLKVHLAGIEETLLKLESTAATAAAVAAKAKAAAAGAAPVAEPAAAVTPTKEAAGAKAAGSGTKAARSLASSAGEEAAGARAPAAWGNPLTKRPELLPSTSARLAEGLPR